MGGVRPGGAVVCVGFGETDLSIPLVPLVAEERRLLGSSAYTAADYQETAATVSARASELASIVGVTAELDDLPAIFEGYATRQIEATKALYLPRAQ
jgi:threonine dehydrogenase-like Zn-dependent dehydrogenase